MHVMMLIAYLFLCVVALVGNILMMKDVSKVSIDNGFNHITCGFHVIFFYFQGFKDLFHCDLIVNG